MYYRRKTLLALLQSIGAPVLKTDFQKYMFLVSMRQQKPAYDFVPYKYGSFSFQLEADKKTLIKYELLEAEDHWVTSSRDDYLSQLTNDDQQIVQYVVDTYRKLSGRKLIRKVYTEYPYFAINSHIAGELLSPAELELVENARPKPKSAKLFTIGYEGKSLEKYLCELLANDVKLLCDVRKNPMSMKYGFNKSQLVNATNALGIEYCHLPELGIESAARKGLETDEEFEQLFEDYKDTTLANQQEALDNILSMIKQHKRVALTCFEADHKDCHRNCVTDAIAGLDSFNHRIVHI